MIRFLSVIILSLFSLLVWSQNNKTEVILCSTIHKAHTKNPNYSYNDLFSYIKRYNPDVIGVEIRENDIDSSTTYLKDLYPFEMYEAIHRFKTKKVVGFDWLGDELEGKAVPKNYWSEISSIKKIQKKLNSDSIANKKLEPLNFISKKKNDLVLTATRKELNNGNYDALNEIYYQQMEYFLKDTDYNELALFYKNRDKKIASNIIRIITENPGKKIILLMGADHRSYSLNQIKSHFGDTLKIKDVE